MSKPMKKGTKIFLIVLIVAALMGICFVCVAIYARNEFNKERSWLPPEFSPQEASVTKLPDNVHDAYTYAMRLYNEAITSSSTEGSWHTDVDLSGDATFPFADADNEICNEIRLGATGAVQALYPTVSNVKMSDEKADDLPEIALEESDILEYSYDPESIFNQKGEYLSNTYEIVFKVDPAFEDVEALHQSSVYQGICDALKDAMTIDKAELETQEVEIRFSIDRLTDQMKSVDVFRRYEVTADVTLTDAYSALAKNDGERSFTVTLPYQATEHINFVWYGLRFTEEYMEQRPGDIMTLPLEIHVSSEAVQGEDFDVTYLISDPSTMDIDNEAVMTVNKTNDVSDTEGVKVTAVLQYEGKTYSDEIIIYITKLEKATTGVRFWKDSFSIAVGQTDLMPADIRVPVNEQSEQRTEEEYSLSVEVSDPSALKVEAEDKELFATALKATSEPVTVKVTMKCGGHTYSAEIPVTITNEAEAMNNG